MSSTHPNAVSTFNSRVTTQAGSGTYHLVPAKLASAASKTMLLFFKPVNDDRGSLEIVDELDYGYQILASDSDEQAIANQRRLNRGKVPGRRAVD